MMAAIPSGSMDPGTAPSRCASRMSPRRVPCQNASILRMISARPLSRAERSMSSPITANSCGSSRESRRRPWKCARNRSAAPPSAASVDWKRDMAWPITARMRSSFDGK